MIENLKINIAQEKKIIEDITSVIDAMSTSPDKEFYASSLNALANQLKIINNSIPSLLKDISLAKPLNETPKEQKNTIQISYTSAATKEKKFVTINNNDKENFVKELQISESGLSALKKIKKEQTGTTVAKPSEVARISNLFFSKIAEKITPQFDSLSQDLKRANIRFLTSTYISMALFFSSLALIVGIILSVVIAIASPSSLSWVWILPFILTVGSITGFYLYPASEKDSVQKQITQELPFATIHMAAIAGSNVEPTKIFKIIASSPEYPNVGLEIRKVINQTDVYGYDLVTALKNTAKQTSNQKLAEMFNGLATNISSGGNLKNYLEKKSENLMSEYRLERNRYNEVAGTFMDVYISILITAPLILMMMFIVMNMGGMCLGIGIQTILILAISGVILVNIIFLFVLEAKQPKS